MPGDLVSHAVLFGRELRRAGVGVTSGQIARFVEALDSIGLRDPASFRDAARATLVSSREDLARFEGLFDRFWQTGTGTPATPPPRPPPATQPRPLRAEVAIARQLGRLPDEAEPPVVDRAVSWSASEVLRRKRFEALTEAETAAILRLMSSSWVPLPERRTRRYRPARRGVQFDWRATTRAAVREGGHLIEQRWRARTYRPRPLIVLADVSGSMERYARMLVHYLHVLVQRSQRRAHRWPVEVFLFGTRLTRVTRALRLRDPAKVAAVVGEAVSDWSGGTRIGESLHAFNRTWGRQVLGRGAIVAIISDGWDRGDPDLVAREMQWLRRRSRGVYWLNPLIGTRGFAPETAGLISALPHIDGLLGAGTLASLEEALVLIVRDQRLA